MKFKTPLYAFRPKRRPLRRWLNRKLRQAGIHLTSNMIIKQRLNVYTMFLEFEVVVDSRGWTG